MKEWMRWVNEVNDAGPRQEDRAVQDPPNFPFPSICQVCLSKNHFWFLIFSSSRRLIIQHSSTLKVRYWWPYLEYILYWLALGGYIDWKSRNQLHVVLFVYFFYIFLLIHCLHYLIFIFNFLYISNIDIFILVMSILTPRLLPSFLYNFKAADKRWQKMTYDNEYDDRKW